MSFGPTGCGTVGAGMTLIAASRRAGAWFVGPAASAQPGRARLVARSAAAGASAWVAEQAGLSIIEMLPGTGMTGAPGPRADVPGVRDQTLPSSTHSGPDYSIKNWRLLPGVAPNSPPRRLRR